MSQRLLLASSALLAVATVSALAVFNVMRQEQLPLVSTPQPVSEPAPRGGPGAGAVSLAPAKVSDTSEPPLKWERVEARRGDDPSHPWDGPMVMKRPAEFDTVSGAIRSELERRGCRIPQSTQSTRPHNVLWGEFDHRGQRDLVVLCVHGDSAKAYVFWDRDVSRVEKLPFGNVGYTLSLGTSEGIEAHAAPNARVKAGMPLTVEHDAIEVGCCECCSEYYYRYRGQWFRAPGAD